MSTALTLVVLIATNDASDQVSSAMTRAARQGLGPETRLIVRELPQGFDDARATALGRTLHADAVVKVTWRDAEHRRATLHVRSEAEGRWVDREIGFDATDADAERGRTLGFALVSMLPDHGDDAPTTPNAAPTLSSDAAGPLATSAPKASAAVVTKIAPRDDAANAENATTAVNATDAEAPARFVTLDTAITGSLGIGGFAGGFGGSLHGGYAIVPRVVLRAGVAARSGDFPPAQATSLFMSASVGARFVGILPTRVQPLGVGFRVDALALRTSLSRPGEAHSVERFTPAVDASVEGSVRLAGPFTLFLALGTEISLGSTDVFVKGENVAAIPLVHAFGELGLRTEL